MRTLGLGYLFTFEITILSSVLIIRHTRISEYSVRLATEYVPRPIDSDYDRGPNLCLSEQEQHVSR